MSVDRIYLQRAAKNIEESPSYVPYSKVRIIVGEDANGTQLVYEAGDDSFRTLEITNPYGTQEIANSILSKIQGYSYKPFTAEGAILNPVAELGDAVNVGEVYSFISSMDTIFSPIMSATISAPEDSNIDHEYPYVAKEDKAVARRINGVRTSFIAELGRIVTEISDTYETKNDSGTKYQQLSASITQTATGILQTVSATYETQTASAAKLADAKGYTDATKRTLETTIAQTATSITQSVSETYETQSAANAQYNNLNSVIEQTARSITQTVSENYATNSALSQVAQTANQISWLVQSGTSYSNFTLTPKAISLVTDTLNLNGFVTFSQLSSQNDKTIINGGNIKTGKISATYIDVDSLRVTHLYGEPLGSVAERVLISSQARTNTMYIGDESSTSTYGYWHINVYSRDDITFYSRLSSSNPGLKIDTYRSWVYPTTSGGWRLGSTDNPFLDLMVQNGFWFVPNSTTNIHLECTYSSGVVILSPALSTNKLQLGKPYSSSMNYALEDIYTRSLHVLRDVSFFGSTASTKQTLSTTTQNMGYTSANANNYLTILNNIVGILANKYGLIGV